MNWRCTDNVVQRHDILKNAHNAFSLRWHTNSATDISTNSNLFLTLCSRYTDNVQAVLTLCWHSKIVADTVLTVLTSGLTWYWHATLGYKVLLMLGWQSKQFHWRWTDAVLTTELDVNETRRETRRETMTLQTPNTFPFSNTLTDKRCHKQCTCCSADATELVTAVTVCLLVHRRAVVILSFNVSFLTVCDIFLITEHLHSLIILCQDCGRQLLLKSLQPLLRPLLCLHVVVTYGLLVFFRITFNDIRQISGFLH